MTQDNTTTHIGAHKSSFDEFHRSFSFGPVASSGESGPLADEAQAYHSDDLHGQSFVEASNKVQWFKNIVLPKMMESVYKLTDTCIEPSSSNDAIAYR